MKQKLLLAVMALLMMATGLRAQTAYVVYCKVDGEEVGSLHFLSATQDQIDEQNNTIALKDGTKLTYIVAWSGDAVTNTAKNNSRPGWNHTNYWSSVTKVKFYESFADVKVKSCFYWFAQFGNLTTVEGIENLKIVEINDGNKNESQIGSLQCMFNLCTALTTIDLSDFDTSNVTSMQSMFQNCSSLESLDLSNFNTSNVTSMSSMFSNCNKLKSITFGADFNTLKVADNHMFNMFNKCNTLRLLDMSKCEANNIEFSEIKTGLGSYRPLTYVPEGTTGVDENMENVVVGEICKHLVIDYDDGTKNNQILLSVPYKFTAEKITINRDFVAGNPHTLYLPFTMDADAKTYGTFYTYGGYDNGTVTFNELTDATTTVNTPYLFKPKASGTIVIDGGITVEPNTTQGEAQIDNETNNETDADANGRFIGVYEKKTFTKDEADAGIYYGWADGKFKRAGEGAKVDACRAYLKLPAKVAGRAPASLSVKFDGDGTTGIGTAKSNADGGAEAPMYNLQGQRVGAGYKGLVIKNGRKVIVK